MAVWIVSKFEKKKHQQKSQWRFHKWLHSGIYIGTGVKVECPLYLVLWISAVKIIMQTGNIWGKWDWSALHLCIPGQDSCLGPTDCSTKNKTTSGKVLGRGKSLGKLLCHHKKIGWKTSCITWPIDQCSFQKRCESEKYTLLVGERSSTLPRGHGSRSAESVRLPCRVLCVKGLNIPHTVGRTAKSNH